MAQVAAEPRKTTTSLNKAGSIIRPIRDRNSAFERKSRLTDPLAAKSKARATMGTMLLNSHTHTLKREECRLVLVQGVPGKVKIRPWSLFSGRVLVAAHFDKNDF